jgi:hypothetical protein
MLRFTHVALDSRGYEFTGLVEAASKPNQLRPADQTQNVTAIRDLFGSRLRLLNSQRYGQDLWLQSNLRRLERGRR